MGISYPIVVSISGDAIEQVLNEFKEDGIGVDFNKIPHISNKPLVYTEGFDTGYGGDQKRLPGLADRLRGLFGTSHELSQTPLQKFEEAHPNEYDVEDDIDEWFERL